MELMILFQVQTGFRLDREHLDLLSQEHAFRTAVRRIFTKCTFRAKFKCISIKAMWSPAPFISAAKDILGHARAGICRRPIASNSDWAHVIRVLIQAHAHGNTKETLGIGFVPVFKCKPASKWVPSALHQFHAELEKRRSI